MAVWPPTLPQAPEGAGYREQAPYHVIDQPMDMGPSKRRPRFTAGIRSFTLSMVLTEADVALLETFYRDTLLGGADPFDWVHPRTQAAVTMQFTAAPQYRPIGPTTYRVTMSLEVLP